MKQTILLTVLSAFLLFSVKTEAQVPVVSKVTKALPKVTLGLKLGANFQELNSSSTFDNSYKGGIVGGVFVGVTKNKIGVQVEGLVKTVKYTVKGLGGSSNVINTMYIDVPVLFEYKFVPRLWLQVGPQFSSLSSAKNGSTDVKSSFNTSDFSGVLGLQAILPVHIVAGARYLMGFSDMNNHTVSGATDSWKNRSFQIYVGYRFL